MIGLFSTLIVVGPNGIKLLSRQRSPTRRSEPSWPVSAREADNMEVVMKIVSRWRPGGASCLLAWAVLGPMPVAGAQDSPALAGLLGRQGDDMQVIRIPAKAWSPFRKLEAPITRRPQGPFVEAIKRSGEKHSIEWHVQSSRGGPPL